MAATAVIAIGGNAIIGEKQKGTVEEQYENILKCCAPIADLYREGYRVVLTHGNGPHVGNLLLQGEATDEVPKLPIDVCGAQTQGQLGYMIQQSLSNILNGDGKVISVVSQMVVSPQDPAFGNPDKPVGPFYTEEQAREIQAQRPDIVMREDAGRGYRRVVPSPEPLEFLEQDSVSTLLHNGYLVITAGGGGIPVCREDNQLQGVEAVIDKDRASALVARSLRADYLIILTGVEQVYLDFNKPTQRAVAHMTVEEAQNHMADGQFPAGSMAPKIGAAIDYIRQGGTKVIITSIEKLTEALEGKSGTAITA